MKNPLAVVVALILVALGALLYVSGDSWDRWRQWAQLPAEQAAVSDRTVAGQQTGDTPPEQQTAAAGVEAKAPAGVDGPPSGQSPLGEAPSGQASSGQPPAGQASSGQAPSAVASNAQQPDASATEGQSSGAPPSDTQAPAATADAQPDAGAAPQNGPTRTAETGQTSTAGATGEAAGQDAMGQGQASATEDGKPSFDIVRVEEDGTAVIAGRAAPKATVTVKLDSAQLGETQANDRGEWVLVVERPLQPGSHNLSAVAAEPGKPAVNSDQVVALALPERAEERPLIVATEPGAPAKVLQAPEPVTPVISPSGGHDLALATVDYNSRGEMIFAGKASSGAKVRLYIDNRHVADTKADAAGDWTLEHKDKIASGTHQLRLDQLNAEGKVVKRIELPFERANEALISQLLGERADEAKADAATAAAPEPQVARIEPTPPAPQPSPSAPPAQMAPRPEAPAQPSPSAPPARTTPREEARTRPSVQDGGTIGRDGRIAKSKDRLAETGTPGGQTTASTGTTAAPTTAAEPAEPQVVTPSRPTPGAPAQQMATAEPAQQPAAAEPAPPAPAAAPEPAAPASEPAPAVAAPEPEPVAPATADAETTEGSGRVVIQPGNNLWRIARVIYGKGVHYTVIYEANKDQIRDPDLIYPGQIFATPGVSPPETIPPGRRRPMEEVPVD